MGIMRILIYGDSITHGFFDPQGGWATRLLNHYHWQSHLDRDKPDARWIEGFNLGISGDTAAGVLKRLEPEFNFRQIYPEETAIVVAIGTNDTVMNREVTRSSPQQYQETMRAIADTALSLTKRLLVVGLPAVDDQLCNPWAFSSTKKSYDSKRIWEFETRLREFCRETHISHVPVFEHFKNHPELFADGLHPNEAGHVLLTSLVKPSLEELITV